jgi:hypothetical protein
VLVCMIQPIPIDSPPGFFYGGLYRLASFYK